MKRSPVVGVAMVICASLLSRSLAAEPDLPTQPKLPKAVNEFCHRALVRDRGIVHIPFFMVSTDEWMLLSVSLNDRLRERIQLSAEQGTQVVAPLDEHSHPLSSLTVTKAGLFRPSDARPWRS
jgi:hypothetical protein